MNVLPTASSIESAFRPAFNEISRRSDVARSFQDDEGPTNFTRSGDTSPFPFDIPDQDYILISMGTTVLAPRPMEICRPSVRIYGAFPTKEDARDHTNIVKEIDPTCSLIVVKRDKWILFPQTEAARDNQEENERIRDTRLMQHTEDMRRADIQFKRDVDSKNDRKKSQTNTGKHQGTLHRTTAQVVISSARPQLS